MSIDTIRQGQALCQALLLGGAMGVGYDLMRILRVRLKLPLLGPALERFRSGGAATRPA